MNKVFALLTVWFMAVAPLSVWAANITTFPDGNTTAMADLKVPDCSDIVNISLPAECHIYTAEMNISATPPENFDAGTKDITQLYVNDTRIWDFNGTGYGSLGMQNLFYNGSPDWKTDFMVDGGTNLTKIRLPKDAVIQDAALNINGGGYGINDHYQSMIGEGPGDNFGKSVSDAGDLNNDGYDDFIVGAPGWNNCGRAYIYYGGPAMDYIPDVVLTGSVSSGLGFSVSGAGDLNGDGYDDVILGAPFWNQALGEAIIYFGGADMDNVADLEITNSGPMLNFGYTVSGVGDLNNDGYDDVGVGVPMADNGYAYIYYGGKNMDPVADISLQGAQPEDFFGMGISGAGDVNKDGYDDLIIGACGSDINTENSGIAYLYLGGASMDTTPDVVFIGSSNYDELGFSVACAGDINKDGYDDIIIGAFLNDAGAVNAGAAYIYYGGANMDSTADVVLTGDSPNEYFGWSVSSAGDVDNDGNADVVVGAPNDHSSTGRAFLYYGGATMDTVADITITGSAADDNLGFSVSSAGDVDGDNCSDILVGAYGSDLPYTDQGSAALLTSENGIKDASLSMGNGSVWKGAWFYNGTERTADFGTLLNQVLRKSPVSGKTKYGNSFVDVNISVSAGCKGEVIVSNLRINYSVTMHVSDFADKLNNYILAHKGANASAGNLSVPILITSGLPRQLELRNISILMDEAPKMVSPIPDQSIPEDTAVPDLIELTDCFTDDFVSETPLQYSIASCTNSSFANVTVENNQFLSVDVLTGDLNDNWTGVLDVVVQCSDKWDSRGLSNDFKIFVTNVNDAPVITSEPPLNLAGGQEYYYQVVAVDGDNDTLTFGLSTAPACMTINSSTGLVHWVPPKGGKFGVAVTVSDGILTGSQQFDLSVSNRAPRITNTTVPTAFVNVPYNYQISAVDDDGDILSYALINPVDQMTLDKATGIIDWTPKQVSTVPVSVGISDGQNTTKYDFNISVLQGNRQPVFVTVPETTAFVGVPYHYDANATDADNDVLEYTVVTAPAGLVINNMTGILDWTPAAIGNFTVKLAVHDGKGGEGIQEFVVIVKNRVPVQVEFTGLVQNQSIKGKFDLSGKAIKGTLDIKKIELQVDSGDWLAVSGNSTWQYTLDTTKLSNGKHELHVRAYDGMDYSNVSTIAVKVDNAKSAEKGFIPGFGAGMVLAVTVTLLLFRWRQDRIKR